MLKLYGWRGILADRRAEIMTANSTGLMCPNCKGTAVEIEARAGAQPKEDALGKTYVWTRFLILLGIVLGIACAVSGAPGYASALIAWAILAIPVWIVTGLVCMFRPRRVAPVVAVKHCKGCGFTW